MSIIRTNRSAIILISLLITLIFPVGVYAYTETFYLAQGGDGTDPKSADPTTAWSAADIVIDSNWDSDDQVDGKIGPNDAVVLLRGGGPITGTDSHVLQIRRSGLSGKPITFKGEEGTNPIVDGEYQRVVLDVRGSDNVVLEGIDFRRGLDFGVISWEADNGTIRDCRFYDTYTETTNRGSTLYWNGNGLVIQRSEFFDAGHDHGAYLEASNVLVEYSYFHDNAEQGLQFNTDGSRLAGNVVRFNRFENNGWADIMDFDCDGLQVYGNTFNRTDSSLYNGIAISGDGSGSGARNTYIHDNTFYGGFEFFIYIYGDLTTGTRITNNIFVATGRAGGSYFIGRDNASSTIAESRFNIFHDASPGGSTEFWWRSSSGLATPDSLADWQSASGLDGSSSADDPLLKSPGTGDFTLIEGSPAIDAGTDTGISSDPNGTSVPQGAATDIGAFEAVSPKAAPPKAPSGLRIQS